MYGLIKATNKKMVTSITLVRYASAELINQEFKIVYSRLTSVGKNQAEKTAKFLEGANFSKIYSSTAKPAIEMAKIITKKEIIEQEELLEFNKIVFEEQPEDIDKFNENVVQALRTRSFFEKLLRDNRDSKILIITHSNVIRYLVCHVLHLRYQKAPSFFIDNASITNLFFDGNNLLSVGCINSTAHLFIDEK